MSKKPHLLRCQVGSKDKGSPTTSNNAEVVGGIGEEEVEVDIAGEAAAVEATMEGEGDTIKEVWPFLPFIWSFLLVMPFFWLL